MADNVIPGVLARVDTWINEGVNPGPRPRRDAYYRSVGEIVLDISTQAIRNGKTIRWLSIDADWLDAEVMEGNKVVGGVEVSIVASSEGAA